MDYMNNINSNDVVDEITYGTPKSPLLNEIIEAGFKPLAITVLMCEETFIFKTKIEADNAAKMFLPEGWWYDIDEWPFVYKDYINDFYDGDKKRTAKIYWL